MPKRDKTTKKQEAKARKQERKQPAKQAEPAPMPEPKAPEPKQQAEPKPQGGRGAYLAIAIIAVIVAVGLFSFFVLIPAYFPTVSPSVPFSTFKANYVGSQSVAVVAIFPNATAGTSDVNCAISVIENGIEQRKTPPKIDFFILNATNCTYSPISTTINETTEPPSQCIKVATSEPSLFINFSATNKTEITAYHMYVWGNSEFMHMCPIAVEFS